MVGVVAPLLHWYETPPVAVRLMLDVVQLSSVEPVLLVIPAFTPAQQFLVTYTIVFRWHCGSVLSQREPPRYRNTYVPFGTLVKLTLTEERESPGLNVAGELVPTIKLGTAIEVGANCVGATCH